MERLKNLIERCVEALKKEADEEFLPDESHPTLFARVDTEQGSISLVYSKDECDVEIEHDDNDHISCNLESYLKEELDGCIDWSEVENDYWDALADMDEWNSHGFRDAADYWHWKEG